MSPSKPQQKAAALKYSQKSGAAPLVIASGYGAIAEKIINIGEEQGIPIYRDDSTASMLCMLEIGNEIPPDLYKVVATIYAEILKRANKINE